MVPNESIAFEVNYRLTESASAGACVLTTPVGEDQNRLYTPDREILIYEQSLELLEKTAFLRRRPDIAEKIGRAAWEATRAVICPNTEPVSCWKTCPQRRSARTRRHCP